MSISFKKFTQFVSLPDDHTDDQITEIFGLFQNNEKLDKLKAQRDKLKKDTAKKVADWRAKKDQEQQDADLENSTPKNIQRRPVPPGYARPRAAAAGRAAERDWVGDMATESRAFTDPKRDRDPKLCRVWAEISAGDLEIDLSNDTLERAIKELTPLKGKKFSKEWNWNGREDSILVCNFSGAERRFSGPNAINKFLETYVGAEVVKGFRNIIN